MHPALAILLLCAVSTWIGWVIRDVFEARRARRHDRLCREMSKGVSSCDGIEMPPGEWRVVGASPNDKSPR